MLLKNILRTLYFSARNRNISYSGCGEDLIANSILSGINKGIYVDVGANDPILTSNTNVFYKRGWSGLCIEPNRKKCDLLKFFRRRDTVICCGAGLTKDKIVYYNFHPDTLGTFSAEDAKEFEKLGHKLISQESIDVLPLAEILENNIGNKEIDLLSIDTEGWDLDVLKSNDWSKFRPKVVLVEVCQYRGAAPLRVAKQFDEFFNGKGYLKYADTYINAIYVEQQFASDKKIQNFTD